MNTLYRWPLHPSIIEEFNMAVWERYTEEYFPPHWHDFYEIELYLSGNATANVNGRECRITPNTLCFLTPADYHSVLPDPGNRILLITFIFTPNCIEGSVINEFITHSNCLFSKIDPDTAGRFATMTRTLAAETTSNRYLNTKYVQNLISCILIELLRLQKQEDTANSFQYLPFPVQKALYYVRTHFKEPIGLDDVSQFVGFSSNYMSKIFRDSLGTGFKEYLTNLRLDYAEQLLRLSDESVTDIAFGCGFNSLSHFLHIFSKRYKISPLQFRKKDMAGEGGREKPWADIKNTCG